MAAVKVLALLSAVCILTAVAEEVAKLALGHSLSCALGSQGSIKCWGDNGNGQLGQGDDVRRGDGANEMGKFLPTIDLGTGRHALEVNSGAFHNCARLDDGLVKCWGRGTKGQLGIGDTEHRGDNSDEMGQFLPTVELGTGRTAVRLGLGYEFGCAVLDDGSLKCWGEGVHGQLGLGTSANMGDGSSEMGDHLPAVDLGTGRTAAEVTAGFYFTCARLDDSSVKCWGSNGFGQIGDGSSGTYVGDASGEMGDNLPTVDLGTGRTAVELSAGGYHVCARLDNGSVKCWGRNHKYQLGLGLDTSTRIGDESNEMGDYLPPVDLGTGRTAAEVSSGYFHTCARLDDGAIRCWGPNDYGEIGHTATLPSNVDLGTGRTAVHVAANGYSTCALLDNLETKCWGQNDDGTLGLGDTQDRGKSSSDMGNSLPAVDIVFPTTTTTTSTTSSLTMTSSSSSSSSATITLSTTRTSSSTSSTSSSSTSTRTVTTTTSTSTTSASTSSSTGTSRTTSSSSASRTSSSTTTLTSTSTTSASTSSSTGTSRTTTSSSASRTSSSTTTLTSTSTTSVSSTGTTSSATSSTAATDDAREVMRKQEAEAAVKEAEAATEVAVQDLLNSLNNTGDNGVMGEVVDTTEAGAVKVVAYDVEALTSSGQNATVSMENSSIGAEVPGDVLAQAQALVGDGPVLLGVVSLSEDLAKKFSNPPADRGPGEGPKAPILRSSPVVVEVRNKNGGIVDLGKLQSPMVVQLEVSHDNDTVKCAYWNETEAVWETDGLVRLELRAGVLRCQTRRLGIFGGVDVLEELENVLKCSSLFEVLTAEGIAKLARPGWLLRTPTVIYLCFLLLFALLLSYGYHMDRQAERAIPSRNRQVTLLREDDDQKETGLCRCNMLRGLCSQVAGQVVFLAGLRRPKQFAKKRIQSLIDDSISQIIAYRMGLDMISINALIPHREHSIQELRQEEEEQPTPRSRGCFSCQPAWMKQVESRARNLAARVGEMAQRASRVHPATSKKAHSQIAQLLDLHRAGNSAVNTVLRGNMRALTLELLPAVHAYSAILRCFSITPVSIQICAIILKILSACFINAIFLTSSAKREDVEGCDTEMLTFEQQLVRGFWIGLLSAVLSDVIILCLLLIQKPSLKKMNQEKWDQQVSKWRCRRCVFWVAAACYAAVCVSYVLVFLASVTYEDSQAWLGATSTSLLKSLLLVPAASAVMQGLLITVALWHDPTLKERIRQKWMKDPQKAGEDQASVDFQEEQQEEDRHVSILVSPTPSLPGEKNPAHSGDQAAPPDSESTPPQGAAPSEAPEVRALPEIQVEPAKSRFFNFKNRIADTE